MKVVLWIILQIIASYQCLHPYPKINLSKRAVGDCGEPLLLTPHIETGQIAKAKHLARVPITDDLGIESYAGFFTVNKTFDSNQFFWYFPSMETDKDRAPVLLWLQGGPGGSSMFGLFKENGPIRVRNGSFERREYHWALNHHLIYIDNPVGAGFSFTNHEEGYLSDEIQVGEQLYSTLTQFFKMFPELQQNEFFISGESYAGKYVPALGYTIHKKNPAAESKINLKGLAIGNGLTDPVNQVVLYSEYLYQIGLVDLNERTKIEGYENKLKKHLENSEWDQASDIFDTLLGRDMIEGKSYLTNVTGFNSWFNYLHTEDYCDGEDFAPMLLNSTVRKGIHVGQASYNESSTIVEKRFKHDIMQSVAPWLSELLSHYNCLIYNGQVDIILAYPYTVNYLRKLNFSGSEVYKTAERNFWKVDGELAGYVKRAGNLVEVLVRNAGHMVPTDQPKWAWDMITRFTHHMSYLT
ncbi:venom serine carboxypeptidase-like [Cydia amplana]|uniref:venom serine carboxypeptidase-like n=1 Tax=Cydia amplana TaxID=1869771 RepID=UPI002FE64D94